MLAEIASKTRVLDLDLLQSGRRVNLQGKLIFQIGCHDKGGGCDFLLPLANVKFHSQLRVQTDGKVTISYSNRNVSIF